MRYRLGVCVLTDRASSGEKRSAMVDGSSSFARKATQLPQGNEASFVKKLNHAVSTAIIDPAPSRVPKKSHPGMHFELPAGLPADEIAWDVETLRVQTCLMAMRCGLSPSQLLLSWTANSRSLGFARRIQDEEDAHRIASAVPSSWWDRRTRVPGGFTVTTISGAALDERHGKRGLNRNAFLAQIRSFLGEKDADLWEHEVKAVANKAFDAILKTVKGENFHHELGSRHFERWIGEESGLSVRYVQQFRVPRKDQAAMQQQSARRLLHTTIAEGISQRKKAWEKHLAKVEAEKREPHKKVIGDKAGFDRSRMNKLSRPKFWNGASFRATFGSYALLPELEPLQHASAATLPDLEDSPSAAHIGAHAADPPLARSATAPSPFRKSASAVSLATRLPSPRRMDPPWAPMTRPVSNGISPIRYPYGAPGSYMLTTHRKDFVSY